MIDINMIKERSIRGNIDFADELKKISLKRVLNGIDAKPSIPKLTKDIISCPSWKGVEMELLEKEKNRSDIPNLKFPNKKGMNIGSLFIWMAISFAFVITMVIIVFFINNLATTFVPIAQGLNTSTVDAVSAYNGTIGMLPNGITPLRWGLYAIVLTLAISILIGAGLSRKHPIILVPYIFIVVVVFIFSVPLSNTYEHIITDPVLASTFDQYQATNWIFLYLPYIVTVIGLIGALLMIMNINRDPDVGGF